MAFSSTSPATGVPYYGGNQVAVKNLTGDTGTAVPLGETIKIAGTSNQVTTSAATSIVTISLPSAVTAPGSVTATTTLTATLGNITATNGDVVMSTAGKGFKIKEGSNARMGQSTLVGGTVTVSNTSVTANSRIFLTRASVGATGAAALGELTVGTITPSTSFVIRSVQSADATALQTTDVSVINWMIVEPA